MQPHEAGLRLLFNSIREQMGGILRRTDDARRVFNRERVAVEPDALERMKQAAERPDPTPPLRAALEESRVFTANVSSFLARDGGTDRIDETARQLSTQAAEHSESLRAVLQKAERT